MAEILPFRKPPDADEPAPHEVRKNCVHEWQEVDEEASELDSSRGVVHYRCKHCGAFKTVVR